MSEKVDRFQPLGFAFAVVTVKNVEAASPDDLSFKISKIISLDRSEIHRRIVAQALTLGGRRHRVQRTVNYARSNTRKSAFLDAGALFGAVLFLEFPT